MHTHLTRPRLAFFLLLTLIFAAPAIAADDLALPASDDVFPGTGPVSRYNGFADNWLRLRTKWAASAEKDKGAVVFLGDSITQGWGDNFRGQFDDVKTANRGISGDTTRGVLYRLEKDVLSIDPAAIVILIGTNDIAREGGTPEVCASNLKLILEKIKQHNPDTPVILCNVFPSHASKGRPVETIKKVNDLYAALVWGDKQVTVVDTWTLFANEKGEATNPPFPDLLHLNGDAYVMWAKAVRPVLATLGLIETVPDDFQLEPGYESLFNGKDLTGWMIQKNAKPGQTDAPTPHGKFGRPVFTEDINLDGKTSSPDGRYVAVNGKLVVTTPIEGRRFQQMYTQREFGSDFTLKLEFRATPNADSGVFIRKPQLQCRDYPLAGPYNDLKNYKQGDWNELVVVVKGNVAHCTCNGEVIEGEFKLPDTGPIGLEGDRGQMEYRRIRIKIEK